MKHVRRASNIDNIYSSTSYATPIEAMKEQTTKAETVEVDGQQSSRYTFFLFLIGLLLSLLCLVFGNRYFTPDNRCQTFGLRMDWNSGPPPT